MVHWNELSDFIKSNPFQTYSVKSVELSVPERKGVSHFPILWDGTPDPDDTNELVLPVPVPVPAAAPKVPVVVKNAPAPAPTPAPAPKQFKTLEAMKMIIDPIVLGIEFSDPLYDAATKMSKREMEIKEAQLCESRIDELYKSQGGRSRGWTKAMLEAAIRPRCASGGNLYELKAAKCLFLWQMLSTDKPTSGFLDFLCVVKQIQVAVWNEEKRTIVVYPAAEYIGDGYTGPRALYNVSNTGHMLKSGGVRTGKDLVTFASKYSWTLLPPSSVIHTLEKLTISELETIGKKLGMAEVTGSKVERIAAVAGFKLKSRLGAVGPAV
jgi:hypothetical protein